MSLFNSCYIYIFSSSSSFTLVSNGLASSIMWHSSVCFSTIKISGFLYSSLRSVCTEKSHSLHCHFLALSPVCFYTTWLHLKIRIFYTLPNKQLHQLYHIVIGGTGFVEAFYIRVRHSVSFTLYAVYSQCLVLCSHQHSLCFFFQQSCLQSVPGSLAPHVTFHFSLPHFIPSLLQDFCLGISNNSSSKGNNINISYINSKTRKTAFIIGDSIVKKIDWYLLTSSTNHRYIVTVRPFLLGKTIDMVDYVKPTQRDFNPVVYLLHVGTNYLSSK